jgi:hypothetical protein
MLTFQHPTPVTSWVTALHESFRSNRYDAAHHCENSLTINDSFGDLICVFSQKIDYGSPFFQNPVRPHGSGIARAAGF